MAYHSESETSSLNTDAILMELQKGPFSKELIKGYQLDLQCTLHLEDLITQEKCLQGDINEDMSESSEDFSFYNKVRKVIGELMGVKNHYHNVLAQTLCMIQEQERKLIYQSVLLQLHNHINGSKDEEIETIKKTIITMALDQESKIPALSYENLDLEEAKNVNLSRDIDTQNARDISSDVAFTIQSLTSLNKTEDEFKSEAKEIINRGVQTELLQSDLEDFEQYKVNFNQNMSEPKKCPKPRGNIMEKKLSLIDEALLYLQKPQRIPTPKKTFTPVLKSLIPQPASSFLYKGMTPKESRPSSSKNTNRETFSQKRVPSKMDDHSKDDKLSMHKSIASQGRINSNISNSTSRETPQNQATYLHSLKKSPSLPSFSQRKTEKSTLENASKPPRDYRKEVQKELQQTNFMKPPLVEKIDVPKGIKIRTEKDDNEGHPAIKTESKEETFANIENDDQWTTQSNTEIPYKIDLGRGVCVTIQMSPLSQSRQSTPNYTPRDSITQSEMTLRNSKDLTDVLALQRGLKKSCKKLAKGKSDKLNSNVSQITQEIKTFDMNKGYSSGVTQESNEVRQPKLTRSQSTMNTRVSQPFNSYRDSGVDNEKLFTNFRVNSGEEDTNEFPLKFETVESTQEFKDSFTQEKPSFLFPAKKIDPIKKNHSPQSSITNSLFQDINSISFNNNDMGIRGIENTQTNQKIEPQAIKPHFELFALKDMNRAFKLRDSEFTKVSSPCFGDRAINTDRGMRLNDENSSRTHSRRSSIKRESNDIENIGKLYGNKNLGKTKKWTPLFAKK